MWGAGGTCWESFSSCRAKSIQVALSKLVQQQNICVLQNLPQTHPYNMYWYSELTVWLFELFQIWNPVSCENWWSMSQGRKGVQPGFLLLESSPRIFSKSAWTPMGVCWRSLGNNGAAKLTPRCTVNSSPFCPPLCWGGFVLYTNNSFLCLAFL